MKKRELIEIDPNCLIPNRFQPRRVFDQNELQELAQSIKMNGLLQPPIIADLYGGQERQFEIIAGERRVQACRLLQLPVIPALLVEMTDQERLESALIENVQRVDLNPLEIALALKKMADELNLDQEEIAQRVGKKRSTVSNFIRLLQLPEEMQVEVSKGVVSMAHAKLILSCDCKKLQDHLFQSILKNGTTIKGCLQIINEWNRKKDFEKDNKKDIHVRDAEKMLERRLGTKVLLSCSGKNQEMHGEVSISFYSLDDLQRLFEVLGVQE